MNMCNVFRHALECKFELGHPIRSWFSVCCWHVMSRYDLDLWPLDLESLWYIGRHVITVYSKFERDFTIRGWVIDD